MKWLYETPIGSVPYLFRQAQYKCENFLIHLSCGKYLASTDQWVSKLHCLSALQRSYRALSSPGTLPSSASNLGVLLQQQPRWSMFVPRTEGKQPKSGALQSTINSNAAAVLMPSWAPTPSQEEPCQAWCDVQDHAAYLLPGVLCSGRRVWGRMRIRRWKTTTGESRVLEPKTALHVCIDFHC